MFYERKWKNNLTLLKSIFVKILMCNILVL